MLKENSSDRVNHASPECGSNVTTNSGPKVHKQWHYYFYEVNRMSSDIQRHCKLLGHMSTSVFIIKVMVLILVYTLFCSYSAKRYGKRKKLFDNMHVRAMMFQETVGRYAQPEVMSGI